MSVDIDIVTEVSDELVAAFDRLIPQLSTSAPPPGRDGLSTIIDRPDCVLFVARIDGAIVGSLTLAMYPLPTGRKAWIDDVVVDGEARGRGVGEALSRAALDEARRRGAKEVDLTSRPTREAANRLYQRLGFVPRDTNVYRFTTCEHAFEREASLPARARSSGGRAAKPAHPPHEILSSVSGATGVQGPRGSPLPTVPGSRAFPFEPDSLAGKEVLGGLADLPVPILQRPVQRGVDLAGTGMSGIEERRQGEDGSAADRWPIGRRREDRVDAPLVADRPEGGDARLAHERIGRSGCRQLDQPTEHLVSDVVTLTARPRRNLDNHRVRVGEGSEKVDAGVGGGDRRGAVADGGGGIGQRLPYVGVVSSTEPLEGPEGGGAHTGIARQQPGAGRCHVAVVPGQRDAAPRRLVQRLNPSAGSSSSSRSRRWRTRSSWR